MTLKTKRTFSLARVIVFGAISLVVFVSAWIVFYIKYGPTKFDQQIWLKGESLLEQPRLRMADGLIKSGELIGLNRDEVEVKLGPKPKTEYFKGYDFVYWLGDERGFISIDSEWLVLKVDQSGKVIYNAIKTD